MHVLRAADRAPSKSRTVRFEGAAYGTNISFFAVDSDPGQGPVAPDRSPQMPYRSRGAAVSQAELARQAALKGSFWEASAREVAGAAGQVGVQSCGQCGLSLSANARFCRRCGTRQAQSA